MSVGEGGKVDVAALLDREANRARDRARDLSLRVAEVHKREDRLARHLGGAEGVRGTEALRLLVESRDDCARERKGNIQGTRCDVFRC